MDPHLGTGPSPVCVDGCPAGPGSTIPTDLSLHLTSSEEFVLDRRCPFVSARLALGDGAKFVPLIRELALVESLPAICRFSSAIASKRLLDSRGFLGFPPGAQLADHLEAGRQALRNPVGRGRGRLSAGCGGVWPC